MRLGKVGVWWSGWRGDPDAGSARAIEELGYGAFWASGRFEPGLWPGFAAVLEATRHLVVASGIASIWVTPPEELADAFFELDSQYPGRFLLGLGASHAVRVHDYARPYGHMVDYLDRLDAGARPVPHDRRLLAALGPKMLALSSLRSAGAHPYFVPVEHTRQARRLLGDGPLLAPEVTVVVERDPDAARALARTFTTHYLALPNYADNLRRLGFGDGDIAGGGSDRLVDAVVAWGDPAAVADRVRAHHEAGADHVCIQVVSADGEFPLAAYQALARELIG